MKITKGGKMGENSIDIEKELKILNQYTKKELTKDEVYIFSLILCDNEIDRDYEKFSDKALAQMAELFVGKTGIFDHEWSAFNQTARIYRTELIKGEGKVNGLGEKLQSLKAYAFMLSTEKNRELILEIEAGIKKEVSVGCSVSEKSCSICGENACAHVAGQNYDGVLCYKSLDEVSDAYEWSFVAVPSQRGAGVTKAFPHKENSLGEFLKSKAHEFLGEFENLKALALLGLEYKESLRQEVLRLSLLDDNKLFKALEKSSSHMEIEELKSLRTAMEENLRKSFPLETQLSPVRNDISFNGQEYLV